MFSSLKLLYIADDIISPDEFPRIVSPSRACHGLSYMPDKDILSLFLVFAVVSGSAVKLALRKTE